MILNAAKRRWFWLLLLGLPGLTALLFAPVAGFEATNYDDPNYVFENPPVLPGWSWAGLRWAFTTNHAANWHPLTWLSHMTDIELFGPDPGPHHVVNLAFHCANTALLFLLLCRLTGALWRSALVAALFAWHPLHVESVAWIAERKDVLSTFFGLLALLAYACHASARKPRNPQPSTRWYFLSLASFTLSLLSKPMLVTLPGLLLLLDFWPLGRLEWRNLKCLLLEKIPFALLSLAVGLVTLLVQAQGGAVRSLENWPLTTRLTNALTATVLYLGKMFWPERLAPFYPMPEHVPAWVAGGAGLLLLLITAMVVYSGQRSPPRLVGWFWFLFMLVPVIGVVQVGMQQMADRYTYLPLVGIFLILAWELASRVGSSALARGVATVAAVAVLALCARQTRRQLSHWHDSEALFRHALAVTEKNYLAHNNLGFHLFTQGRRAEALAEYRAALLILPTYTDAHSNLGRALADAGEYAEAAEHFAAVLERLPDDVIAHNNLGNILAMLGRHEEAIGHFRAALAAKPDHAAAHNNWALSAEALHRPMEAIAHYREAMRLAPGFAAPINNLAWLLATGPEEQWRNGAEALQLAQRLCALVDCSQSAPLLTLAAACAEAGQFEQAISVAIQALEAARRIENAAAIQTATEMLAAFHQGRAFRAGGK